MNYYYFIYLCSESKATVTLDSHDGYIYFPYTYDALLHSSENLKATELRNPRRKWWNKIQMMR